jgi:hypothetical protein
MERPGPSRPARGLAVALSLALHSLLFFVVIVGRLPEVPDLRPRVLLVAPQLDHPRTVPTLVYAPRTDQGTGRPRDPLEVPSAAPVELPPRVTVPRGVDSTVADTIPVRRGPGGWLGAGPGDGRLWVRPLPLPPRALARRLDPEPGIELLDSAVTAIVQAYLDSMAREPGSDQVPLPEWTTEIEGMKFGLDARNIYIAGLRIPSVVLALLPLPAMGNQSDALDKNGAWMAEDLRRAALRASDLDDFKEAIRELRERKQREKDIERAQRAGADSTSSDGKAGTP